MKENINGDVIIGIFYEQELPKTKHAVCRIKTRSA